MNMTIADYIAADTRIQPDGRRTAIAATFAQQEALCISYCADFGLILPTIPELRDAFARLSVPREADDGPTASRRTTLREVAAALPPDGQTDAGSVLPWFRATVAAFAGSDDPRQRAMAATAAREAGELGDDFPAAVIATAALPADAGGIRATDVGAEMTRYPSDNIPPDAQITMGWVVGSAGSTGWESSTVTRAECVAILERLGCRFNDSALPIACWIADGADGSCVGGPEWTGPTGTKWARGIPPRDGGPEYIGPVRPVRTAMLAK